MSDFSSLSLKISSLKAMVERDSITPLYLGSLLDDFIAMMSSIDMSDMAPDIRQAITDASAALRSASLALKASNTASSEASAAFENAVSAMTTASNALQIANGASKTASKAATVASSLSTRVADIETALPDKLGSSDFFELEALIDEASREAQRANSDLSDYKTYLGIFPFDGTVVHAADVMKLAEGSVCFAITEGCFVKNAASGPSYGVPHNILNNVGGFESIRTDVVFRCGAKLYVPTSGSGISELESSTLRDYIISVRNGARNDLNDLEERMAMLRFDGMAQSVDDIRQEDTDSVWYVVDELCFYQPDEAGLSSSLPHNDSDRLMARDDVIFYCDGVLYRFDGELVEWNAEINARVDEIDAATRLNAANTGITAFDGTVSEADGVMHRPEGAIVYVEKLGYFVERTPSGLSYGVPHNTFDPKYGSVTGVRSDIFFRCGSTLYRHNGTALVAVTGDIEVVKTALFDSMWASIGGTKLASGSYRIGATGKELTLDEALVRYERNGLIDEWNERCTYRDAYQRTRKIGQYNEYTQLFELNGITDITASEAISILALGYPKDDAETYYYYHRNLLVRTNFPPERTLSGWNSTFSTNRFLTVANIGENYNGEIVQNQTVGCMAYNCLSLRKVIGILDVQTTYYQYGNCPALQEAKIITTKAGNTINLGGCPALNIGSVRYTVDNTTVACCIIYHPDIYAKLTGDTTNAAAAALSEEELAQWQALDNAAAEKGIAIATV